MFEIKVITKNAYKLFIYQATLLLLNDAINYYYLAGVNKSEGKKVSIQPVSISGVVIMREINFYLVIL